MKRLGKITPILLLVVYMSCLLIVGLMMFQNAGRQTNKKISIYKENNTPILSMEHEAESEYEITAEMQSRILPEPEIEDAGDTISEESFDYYRPAPQIVDAVRMKIYGYPVTKDEFNGLNLQDNGLPYAIKVNRQENIVTVYELDAEGYYTVPVRTMRCSVSANGVTPTGLYSATDRYEWRFLFGGVFGQYACHIVGNILFHSVPYVSLSNSQLETWEYNKLGTGASLGCIRLCVADAKWIYDNCSYGTKVNIFDSDYYGPLGRPQPAYVFEDTENTDWDPTDMTEENPYTEKGQIFGVSSHTIQAGEPFDEMSGVMAFSSDLSDVTDILKVEGKVNNRIAGDYPLIYTFDDHGQAVTASCTITVEDNEAPVMAMAPEKLVLLGYIGDTAGLVELIGQYVTAYDGDTQITTVRDTFDMSGELGKDAVFIDVSKVDVNPGMYEVDVFAIDCNGNISETVKVMIHIIV